MKITDIIFEGATELIKEKKEKKTKHKRGGIICDCGALAIFFTALYYMHDDNCIINTKRKK